MRVLEQRSRYPYYTPGGLLHPYLVIVRPYLMFVSGITGIAALSFVPAPSTEKTLLIAVASFLSYGFGQALTDCFQIDTDSLSAPYRPLTNGSLSKKQALIFSISGLAACILAFSFFYPANILLGMAGGIGLATYTPFKRKWWGGPLYNAWIVVVLFLMAFLAGKGADAGFSLPGFLGAACVVLFGYANFVLSGYFKDVEADHLTGYETLPIRFGRRRSAFASDGLAFITLLSAFFTFLPKARSSTWIAWALMLSGMAVLAIGQLRLHSVNSDARAHRAIVPILHSYLLLLSGLAVLEKPTWGIPLISFYAGFTIAMRFRPTKQQI